MNISVSTVNGEKFTSVMVDPSMLIETLKELVAADLNVPPASQEMLFGGRVLLDHYTIAETGVKDNDLIELRVRSGKLSLANIPAEIYNDVPALHRYLRHPDLLTELLHANPPMAEAVLNEDPTVLRDMLLAQQEAKRKAEQDDFRRINQLNSDPFNLENQRRIEEEIRQKNVQENMESAMEYTPEAFARVYMLYVPIEVNKVPLAAFVDSGAQITIMSVACAERCGLMRLLDTRFQGMAKGVGTAKILGKVHQVPVKVGSAFFAFSFTIMEQRGMDILFGLDQLKQHQACIDLKANALHIGDQTIPFLAEKDIPLADRDGGEDEEKSAVPPSSSSSSSSSRPSSSSSTSRPSASASRPTTTSSSSSSSSTPSRPVSTTSLPPRQAAMLAAGAPASSVAIHVPPVSEQNNPWAHIVPSQPSSRSASTNTTSASTSASTSSAAHASTTAATSTTSTTTSARTATAPTQTTSTASSSTPATTTPATTTSVTIPSFVPTTATPTTSTTTTTTPPVTSTSSTLTTSTGAAHTTPSINSTTSTTLSISTASASVSSLPSPERDEKSIPPPNARPTRPIAGPSAASLLAAATALLRANSLPNSSSTTTASTTTSTTASTTPTQTTTPAVTTASTASASSTHTSATSTSSVSSTPAAPTSTSVSVASSGSVSSTPQSAPATASASTQTPAATASASASVQPPTPATSAFPEESIGTLMAMGFNRAQCIQALTVCDGNIELAGSFLFQG